MRNKLVFEYRTASGDSSTRFLKYILDLDGFQSYMPLHQVPAFLDPKHTFYHRCMKDDDTFRKAMEAAVYDGGPYGPVKYPEGELRIKKVFPPQLKGPSTKDAKRWTMMKSTFADDSINHVVFPAILERKDSICENSDDTLKHQYCFVYRKRTNEGIILDDIYLSVHRYFAYKWIARAVTENAKKSLPFAIQSFIQPYIASWVPEASHMTYHVPMPSESMFSFMIRNGAQTFRDAYRAYLLVYISNMQRNIDLTHAKLMVASNSEIRANPSIIKTMLAHLDDHNNTFLTKHKTALMNGSSLISLESRKEIANSHPHSMRRSSQVQVVPVHSVRNSTSITRIQRRISKVLQYMEHKYPNMRSMVVYWQYDDTSGQWVIVQEDDFDEKWREAIEASDVRFICFYVKIQEEAGDNHANIVIYDKKNNTLERFEPNSKEYVEDNADRYMELDVAIETLDIFEELQPRMYNTESACLNISPHTEEGKEMKELFKYHGGSCAVWSMWYMDLRLSNPDANREKMVKYALQYIEHMGSFKLFINSYRAYLKRGADMIRSSSASSKASSTSSDK